MNPGASQRRSRLSAPQTSTRKVAGLSGCPPVVRVLAASVPGVEEGVVWALEAVPPSSPLSLTSPK